MKFIRQLNYHGSIYKQSLSPDCGRILSTPRQHQLCRLFANVQVEGQNETQPKKSPYNDVVPKIGLEVHAQLKLKSKLFSQGGNSKISPNSHLDLFDIALPGTLPILNARALRLALLTSLGLNCKIQNMMHFDRKNYFYTDMPAGYQITQYNKPVARNGYIDFIVTTYHSSSIAHAQHYDLVKYLYGEERLLAEEIKPYLKRSYIKQIQLEQDSAKSLHHTSSDTQQEDYSLLDYNRSGAGLVEIVFEPDLSNHHEASSLIKELIQILKALDTCDCQLQEGSLRVDANISIQSISGQEVENSGRVELKNLNSIRSLNRGIAYEVHRQASLIRNGDVVAQESRTFDTKAHKSIPLRVKEEAIDYRYVPEPNIPPIQIEDDFIQNVKKDLPQSLPCDLRNDLLEKYNLDLSLVSETLIESGLCNYLIEIMKKRPSYDINIVADFLIYTIANLKNIVGPPIKVELQEGGEFWKRLYPDRMCDIFDMMFAEEISFAIAYEVIKHYHVNGDVSNPSKIVTDFDWFQIKDREEVKKLCSDVISSCSGLSKKYKKKGDKKHLRVLLDKLCEKTDGRISIRRAIESINEQLRSPVKVG